jgi:uncharacterized Zn-binding protein involved in type VI secretion
MGANVFANGLEISCKASDVHTMGAMPDVCLSPPSPPAGPVPIPYPNFSKASDTTDGSKTVKIRGKEVGLKGKSSYKQSKGDEAATNSLGAGVLSHKIQGSVIHQAGSMNVKVEGCNVFRFGDLTTGNHVNSTNGPTVPGGGTPAPAMDEEECKELHRKNNEERERFKKARRKKGDQRRAHTGVREAARGNTTISHAKWTGPGQVLKAASKDVIRKFDNSFKQGLTAKQIKKRTSKDGKKVSSGACGGHKYKKTSMPHTSHTEARIIEEIFKTKPTPTSGTLVIAVNWPGGPAKGKRTSDPCDACKELICAAMACLNIELCHKKASEKPDCEK